MQWSIEKKNLKLAYTWKISRNASDEKTNYIIKVNDGGYTGLGEVAPNVRYGETPETIEKAFEHFIGQAPSAFHSAQELVSILQQLQIPNALSFGIESAWTHAQAAKNGKAVYEWLGLEAPGPVQTTYTLPIMDPGEIQSFIRQHQLHRFHTLKVKINRETGLDLIEEVIKHSGKPLKIDANEAWEDVDDLIRTMEKVKHLPIEFWEQPLPGKMESEYVYLKKHSLFELIADESVTNQPDFDQIQKQFHGVNMKLMKAGSYWNGIRILQKTKKLGLKTMIGCMVETTLGISSGMNLCAKLNYVDLDGFFVIENEPFKLVHEREGSLYFQKT